MQVMIVLGARPQFIKAAPIQRALCEAGMDGYIIHTGQHYDANMSDVFFTQLGLREPRANLGIGSGSHGAQTGQMLIGLEREMRERRPDLVMVLGDTNSTLAGAIAAAKLNIPIAHVEAGLRSFNRTMPEEHNRVLTDHCSDYLFCPTQSSVELLAREGVTRGVHLVGDTMYDAVRMFTDLANQQSRALETLGLQPRRYLLATIHRPYNTDVPANLLAIMRALGQAGETIVFPVHPRTRQCLKQIGWSAGELPHVLLTDPVGYLDMLVLERNARLILTDSGGVQKEAYFFSVPCVTLRPETEWVETVQAGWNVLVDCDPRKIVQAIHRTDWPTGAPPALFGEGDSSRKIAEVLSNHAPLR